MKKKLLMLTTVATAVGVAFLIPLPGTGQDGPPAAAKDGGGKGGGKGAGRGGGKGGGAPQAPAGPMARTPDGHPDFSGFWTPPDHTNIEPAAGRGGGAPGGGRGAAGGPGGGAPGAGGPGGPGGGPPGGGAPGGGAPGGFGGGRAAPVNNIIDPPDGLIPYKAEARAKQQDLLLNHLADEPELNCYQSGVPHSESNRFGAQIIMTPGYFVQLSEFMHTVRIIPTDGRKHIAANIHLFQGDPVGHWEGDSLVVDTTNQNTKTWFDTSGNFKTENLHVSEKFTPQDANTIVYEATMTDPTIYTQPWTARWMIRKNMARPNSDGHPYEQMEFACIEGNEDLGHYTEDKGGKQKQVLGKKQ